MDITGKWELIYTELISIYISKVLDQSIFKTANILKSEIEK